jgi:glycerophosphoryl diester phosphodiesterase
VQTLHEVLDRFRDRAHFWIELPAGSDAYPEIEERVLSTLEVYDVVDRTLVQSSDPRALAELRRLSREVRLGAIARPPLESPPFSNSVQAVCPRFDALTEGEILLIHEAGLECYPWTLREPAEVHRLLGWRVDGFFTDRPGSLRAELDRRD